MKQKTWFETWFNSPYYKVLYQNRDHIEAENFTDALLGYLAPASGSRLLDIGCGEGRFALHFANAGYDVVGIDLASNSIAKALESEADKLHFFVHDMRRPVYINYFDYSFNLFTSFGYFAKARDNEAAAKAFADGLKKGGKLVIDYLNKDWVLQNLKPFEIIEKEGFSFDIQKEYNGTHIIKHIRFMDADGKKQHYTEKVSAFSLHDFVTLFAAQNMELTAQFGNYQLDAYDEHNSPRLIMVFEKK